MLNKWRYVKYEGDGVSLFQCLACHETWSANTTPERWKFCPYCGSRWEEQQKWDEDKKYRYPVRAFASPYAWVIQERIVHSDDIGEWRDTYHCIEAFRWGEWTMAKDVLNTWLLAKAEAHEFNKNSDWSQIQVRLVIRSYRGDKPTVCSKSLECLRRGITT